MRTICIDITTARDTGSMNRRPKGAEAEEITSRKLGNLSRKK